MERTILLYSKYSPNSKQLLNLISQSGVDLSTVGLQYLCVDNSKVRKQIKRNNKINVGKVPCILRFLPDGLVEKYDGNHAFQWIQSLLTQLAPPPPPPRPQPIQQPIEVPTPKPKKRVRIQEDFQEMQYDPSQGRDHTTLGHDQVNQRSPSQYVPQAPDPNQIPSDIRSDMQSRIHEQYIESEPRETSRASRSRPSTGVRGTAIEDLPFEEEESEIQVPKRMQRIQQRPSVDDRHVNVPQPPRIRQGSHEYIEEDIFFQDDPVDNRHEPSNVIRNNPNETADPHGTMARVKEIAQSREMMESETMQNRPDESRFGRK